MKRCDIDVSIKYHLDAINSLASEYEQEIYEKIANKLIEIRKLMDPDFKLKTTIDDLK